MCDTKLRLIHIVRMFLLYFFICKQTFIYKSSFFLITAISNYSTLMVGALSKFINVAGKCHTNYLYHIDCHSLPASIYLSF